MDNVVTFVVPPDAVSGSTLHLRLPGDDILPFTVPVGSQGQEITVRLAPQNCNPKPSSCPEAWLDRGEKDESSESDDADEEDEEGPTYTSGEEDASGPRLLNPAEWRARHTRPAAAAAAADSALPHPAAVSSLFASQASVGDDDGKAGDESSVTSPPLLLPPPRPRRRRCSRFRRAVRPFRVHYYHNQAIKGLWTDPALKEVLEAPSDPTPRQQAVTATLTTTAVEGAGGDGANNGGCSCEGFVERVAYAEMDTVLDASAAVGGGQQGHGDGGSKGGSDIRPPFHRYSVGEVSPEVG